MPATKSADDWPDRTRGLPSPAWARSGDAMPTPGLPRRRESPRPRADIFSMRAYWWARLTLFGSALGAMVGVLVFETDEMLEAVARLHH